MWVPRYLHNGICYTGKHNRNLAKLITDVCITIHNDVFMVKEFINEYHCKMKKMFIFYDLCVPVPV